MFQRLHHSLNGRIYSMNYNVKYFYTFLCLVIMFLFLYSYTYMNTKNKKTYSLLSDARYKKIYVWNTFWRDPTFEFGLGSEPFREKNCDVQDCVIVYNEHTIPIEDYDAVVFHGPEFHPHSDRDFPSKRMSSQRYVYFSMESPLTRPIFGDMDNFYNWTMSYRLDSEILVFYFGFFDITTGEMVSNTNNPIWMKKTVLKDKLEKRRELLRTKKKPVAWFVSNCKSKNKRQLIVQDLKEYINVDVYGKCGTLECIKNDPDTCNRMLRDEYFFYLSFENSNCEDYVTEKLWTAYDNDLIPIYYGGANLSKFLPPDSYIDARNISAKDLAEKMKYLIDHPDEYLEYFWWKDFYSIESRWKAKYKPFCKLCAMLHDDTLEEKTYKKFHHWWNTYNGRSVCNKMS